MSPWRVCDITPLLELNVLVRIQQEERINFIGFIGEQFVEASHEFGDVLTDLRRGFPRVTASGVTFPLDEVAHTTAKVLAVKDMLCDEREREREMRAIHAKGSGTGGASSGGVV